MYITINDIKGEKRIDLSYSIDSDKEITVIIMLSDNIQYNILKLRSVMDPISDRKKMISSGTYAGRELTSMLEGIIELNQFEVDDQVTKTNKLKGITEITLNLDEFDNSNNLKDGRPSNSLFTYYMTSFLDLWKTMEIYMESCGLHANYVLVPADKAANNVIIVCKKYYIDTLVKELGINNVNINNPTYIPIDDSFETIMKSHDQFITSVGLEISEENQNLPYLYWTPKLHKSPYKHRFIAGSSKCTTKDLSCLLTKVLSTIKDGLVRYCNTKTSHNGVNNMWILKNSTSLLSSLDQLDVRTATSVQKFDFQHFTPQYHMIY